MFGIPQLQPYTNLCHINTHSALTQSATSVLYRTQRTVYLSYVNRLMTEQSLSQSAHNLTQRYKSLLNVFSLDRQRKRNPETTLYIQKRNARHDASIFSDHESHFIRMNISVYPHDTALSRATRLLCRESEPKKYKDKGAYKLHMQQISEIPVFVLY